MTLISLLWFDVSLPRFGEAAPLLEVIFYIREKLVTICHVSVLECLIELVACLAEVEVTIFLYSQSSVLKHIQLIYLSVSDPLKRCNEERIDCKFTHIQPQDYYHDR